MKKFKQIAAITGVVLLVAMYAMTLITALMKNDNWLGWFQASLFCTAAVPILIYAMQLLYRILKKDKPE